MEEKEIQVFGFVNDKYNHIKEEEEGRRTSNTQKDFRERNKVDQEIIRKTEQVSRRIAQENKIINISEGMKKKEKYAVPKITKKTVKKAHKKSRMPKIAGRLLVAGLVGVAVFGGVKKYQEYKEYQNNRLALEDILDDNITLEKLGLDDSIENKIEELKQRDIESLSNSELINLPEEINDVQFDIIKSKLSNVLGTYEGNIEVKQSVPNRVEIYKDEELDKVFTEADKIDEIINKIGIKNGNLISPEIGKFISDIANMQTISEDITRGDINRDSIIKECKKSIENADKFAAEGMIKDGNLIKMVDATELAKHQEKETDGEEISF